MNFRQHSHTLLNTSTAHIPVETIQALASAGRTQRGPLFHSITFVPFGDVGWIFYVSSDAIAGARDCGHEALARVIDFAGNHGFDWLKLDASAPPLDELPQFDH